jgi:flagellar protein FlbD
VIEVTRLSGSTLVLNADAIERVESTPDTVITLVTGSTYVVRESVGEVVASVLAYKTRVFAPLVHSRLAVLDGGED